MPPIRFPLLFASAIDLFDRVGCWLMGVHFHS